MAQRRNTEWVYIKGKSRWTTLPPQTPDTAFGGVPKYKITVYPIPDDIEVLRGLQKEGMKNQEKRDEDGSYFTFGRPTSIQVLGKVVGLEPPTVMNADGTPNNDGNIGKGSDVTIKLEVRKYQVPGGGRGVSARLASVRIDSLVPWKSDVDMTKEQQKAIDGLMDQPKPSYNF